MRLERGTRRLAGTTCLLLLWASQAVAQTAATDALGRVAEIEARLAELEGQAKDRADDAGFFFELGNLYADLSRRDDAVGAYEAALSVDTEYIEAMVNLGAIKNEQGKTDEAIVVLERASALRPDESRVFVNLGNAYYSAGDHFAAVTQYRRALDIDPNAHEAHYQMGVAFADAGIYREAIREWRSVVDIAPDTDAAKSAQENIEVVELILEEKL